MVDIGVVHGRFQAVHMGYMEYILAAKMRCKKLVIGIGNPDISHLQYNRFQKGGMQSKANPFTYYEKMQMIRAALSDFGVKEEDVEFTPFPLDVPSLLRFYVPEDAVFYMMMLDDWAAEKQEILEKKMGYRTEILRSGKAEEKRTTSSLVLETIGTGGQWEHMVPRSVCQYMKKNGLDQRVRRLWKEDEERQAEKDDPMKDVIIRRMDKDPEPTSQES